MGSSERTSPHGAQREERWLGSERAERSRPWAYEDLLFGSSAVEDDALNPLAAELAADLAELRRMQLELHDQVVKLALVAGRLQAARRPAEPPHVQERDAVSRAEIRSLPSDRLHPASSEERGGALARCEGFRVDSPGGFVGFVDGLRFMSRIDEPDLLEVRGGRFGRELALIPIEAVEEISLAEERIVIRGAPELHDTNLRELVDRLRKALHSVI